MSSNLISCSTGFVTTLTTTANVGLYGECAREAARNIMENLNG